MPKSDSTQLTLELLSELVADETMLSFEFPPGGFCATAFHIRLTESLDSGTERLLFAVAEWNSLNCRSLNHGASTLYGWIALHSVSPQ